MGGCVGRGGRLLRNEDQHVRHSEASQLTRNCEAGGGGEETKKKRRTLTHKLFNSAAIQKQETDPFLKNYF